MMATKLTLVSAFDIVVLESSGCCRPALLCQCLIAHLRAVRARMPALIAIVRCLPTVH